MNPMLMAVSDGRIQHVCTFASDDPWSINLKKGVASAFQNALPTTSVVSSGLNFTEVDVIGKCPTRYDVQNEGSTLKVTKTKNHKLCQDNYFTKFGKFSAWQKAPLPLEESKSVCRQEITNGIYTNIICEDKNILRPSIGSYKYVIAHQKSTLSYQSETNEVPDIARFHAMHHKASLLYDHNSQEKRIDLEDQIDLALKKVCQKTKLNVEEDTAYLMATIIRLLRDVRESIIESMLQKIASGQICNEHQRLEELFLDAIAFVHEPETVNIMVKELISGRAIGGRALLYTTALHLIPRPDIIAVAALQPLFEVSRPLGLAKLAAASMVHTYCRQNPHCNTMAQVRELASALSQQVEQHCIPTGSEITEHMAVASLKALGNMGVMHSEVANTIIKCIETDGIHNSVQVAAAQAFRNAECEKYTTKQLINIMTDESKNTEVRIASYLAALPCVEKEDLLHIISKISAEDNTQVRGFILSHLLNIQETSLPYKRKLQTLLVNYVLPVNFTRDIRKYSRNVEKSFFIEPLGLGAAIESDIIYAPGSFLPRSINLNLTSEIGGTLKNFGEFGARIEGLENIFEKLLGPMAYLDKKSFSSILHDFGESFKEKGARFLEDFIPVLTKQRRSVDFATVSNFLKNIYKREQPGLQKLDIFARLENQEILYGYMAGDLRSLDTDRISEIIYNLIDEILGQLSDIHINTARAGQFRFDYSIPTIQGIPLKLQMEGTAVIGLILEHTYNAKPHPYIMDSVHISPGISLQINGFVGFDMYFGRTGIKMENMISTNNGLQLSLSLAEEKVLQVEVVLPEKLDLFTLKSETYLMRDVEGHEEIKILPKSLYDIRFQKAQCIAALESILGLQICQVINIPNILRSRGVPLGQQSHIKFSVEKTDPSIKKYVLLASMHDFEGSKVITVNTDAPGSTQSRTAKAVISYKEEHDSMLVAISVNSSSTEGNIWLRFIQQVDYEALEVFVDWNSYGEELLGGVKVELKSVWKGHHLKTRVNEINVYSSHNKEFPPASKMVEIELDKTLSDQEENELFVGAKVRTVNHMKQYFDLHLFLTGTFLYSQSLEIWLPRSLGDFELNCKAGYFEVLSYIRMRLPSMYQSTIKVFRMNEDLVNINMLQVIKLNSLFNMHIDTTIRGHIMDSLYEVSNEITFAKERKGISLSVARGEGLNIVNFVAIIASSSSHQSMKLVIDIPAWLKAVKFEGKLTKQDESEHMLNVALLHGRNLILQVHGPVRGSESHEASVIQADVTVTAAKSRPFSFAINLEWEFKKQLFDIDIGNERGKLFSAGWLLQVDSSQQWKIRSKFDFPILLDSNMEVLIKEKTIHINTNNLIFPQSSTSRRIKAQTDVDFEQLAIKTDLMWDADRDAMKKVHVQVKVISNPLNPDHITLHGTTVYRGETYGLTLDTSGLNEHSWTRGVNVDITTPRHRSLHLETKFRVLSESTYSKLEFIFFYKDLGNRILRGLKHVITLRDYHMPEEFKVETETLYTNPHNEETTFKTLSSYHSTGSSQFIEHKVRQSC
ncbi:hypothetical protein SK128_006666 [Halocaridina rubra]|uniref:Vitellogenin domain-containing protein n=1 Tax=Halocaridina rubra TaxID=373956 RepID=A0AAN8X5K8_HALRR